IAAFDANRHRRLPGTITRRTSKRLMIETYNTATGVIDRVNTGRNTQHSAVIGVAFIASRVAKHHPAMPPFTITVLAVAASANCRPDAQMNRFRAGILDATQNTVRLVRQLIASNQLGHGGHT